MENYFLCKIGFSGKCFKFFYFTKLVIAFDREIRKFYYKFNNNALLMDLYMVKINIQRNVKWFGKFFTNLLFVVTKDIGEAVLFPFKMVIDNILEFH